MAPSRLLLFAAAVLPFICTVTLAPSTTRAGEAAAAAAAAEPISFERHIRPILKAYCFDCHGAEEEVQANLDVRLRRLIAQGGDSGPAISPGQPEASLLLQRVRSGEMPPGDKKLSVDDVAALERWIAAGAPTLRDEPPGMENDPITFDERAHWAFQPIRRPAVSAPAPEDGARTAIDVLLMSAMRPHGLSFSPDADKLTLLKRASFDLIGLPPTPDEVAEFLADSRPDAYERLLDRLLASPRYGERWARHWLDVAGYADSDGYTEADSPRPYAYKYRDYVVRSLNADKPFDQFIIEQVAGDELVSGPYHALAPDDLDKVIATGFLRMGQDGTESGAPDLDIARNQVLAETIKIVSTSLLGLSVGCAQCHDHRYDPIPQTDYYRMRAVFEPAYDWKNWRGPSARLVSLYTDDDRLRAADIEAQVAVVAAYRAAKDEEFLAVMLDRELQRHPAEVRDPLRVAYNTPVDQRSDEQKMLLAKYPSVAVASLRQNFDPVFQKELEAFDVRIAEIRADKLPEEFVSPLNEVAGHIPETFLFYRGDHRQPRQAVPPGGLTVVAASGQRMEMPPDDASLPTSGRRLALARWLTGREQPLTARVLVNRIWLHHFGRGIVGTPADFGIMGDRPTHPELLDWLADEFVASGWSLKRLHKEIMTSTVYRQSSANDSAKEAIDAENRWYSRAPVRRSEGETLRDRMLATSGVLNTRMYGPAIEVRQDAVGQTAVGPETPPVVVRPGLPLPQGRPEDVRSIYIQVRRSLPLAMLTTFDAPVMEVNCERRASSTVAPQALMLMNSEFVLTQSAWFAVRVRSDAGDDPAQQVRRAWQIAFCRPPTEAELAKGMAFRADQLAHLTQARQAAATAGGAAVPGTAADDGFQALVDLCQVLLSANEFLYVD